MPISIDLETYSPVDLKLCGMFVYFENPLTEIMCFSYKVDEGPTQLWQPDLGPVRESHPELHYRAKHGDLFTGWVAGFEFTGINANAGRAIHMPELKITQMRDTAAVAASLALPRAMGKCAEVLRMRIQKDEVGKRAMLKLSKPRNPTKSDSSVRWTPLNAPEDFKTLYQYNINDVDTEYGITKYLGPLSGYEQVIWELDYIINNRGIPIDKPMAQNIIKMREEFISRLSRECKSICGFNPSQVKEIYNWVTNTLGFQFPQMDDWGRLETRKLNSLDKDDIQLALAGIRSGKTRASGYISPEPKVIKEIDIYGNPFNAIYRVLEIRQQTSQSSTKKYDAMLNMLTKDNRVRGAHLYWGAGTGRWAAKGVQFQNVKKSTIGHKLTKAFRKEHSGYNMAIEFANIASVISLPTVEMLYEKPMDVFSSALRSCIKAPSGYELIYNDYSSIEARILAWLAGEKWRMDVFNGDGKIYEASASLISGVPVDQILEGSKERDSGKVAELALGFGGAIGAMLKMGAVERYGLKYEALKPLIKAWRVASPKIVQMWYDIAAAVITAMQTGTIIEAYRCRFGCGALGKDFFHVQLPSKRLITYVYPRLQDSIKIWDDEKDKFEIYVETKHPLHAHKRTRWNPEIQEYEQYWHEGFRPQKKTEFIFEGENSTTRQWQIQTAWHGTFIENIVQATGACLLRNALIETEKGGFANIMHVHDESGALSPIGAHQHKEQALLMCKLPDWAEGLPVKAAGWQGERYRKG